MTYFEPDELGQMEREEQAARERAAALRNQQALSDGEAPVADKRALQLAEEDWKRLRDRLEHFRKTHQPPKPH